LSDIAVLTVLDAAVRVTVRTGWPVGGVTDEIGPLAGSYRSSLNSFRLWALCPRRARWDQTPTEE
jgi:hypothetical protein